MALLLDTDYQILQDSGLKYEEDESKRFLIIKDYPLKTNLYVYNNNPINTVNVLVVIPPNYNTTGTDMLWTHPPLSRTDGITIPNASGLGGDDARFFGDTEYCRWSRHYPPDSWNAKSDNIQKILSRIEWALKNPDSQR